MTKQELIMTFIRNHQETIGYINNLDDQQFVCRYNNKWTAGQHLQHIFLTIVPFPKVLASKEFILEKFGKINRLTWDYETVLENYFKTSLKAPEQFIPQDEITPDQKSKIISDIRTELENIERLFNNYSEEELDTFVLPHPLLGKLTIREMFYLMAYHPIHHQKQIESAIEDYNHQGKM